MPRSADEKTLRRTQATGLEPNPSGTGRVMDGGEVSDAQPLGLSTPRRAEKKKGDSFWLGLLFSSICGLPLAFRLFTYTRENYCFNMFGGCPPHEHDSVTAVLWLGLFLALVVYGIHSIRREQHSYGTGLIVGAFLYFVQAWLAMAFGVAF